MEHFSLDQGWFSLEAAEQLPVLVEDETWQRGWVEAGRMVETLEVEAELIQNCSWQ